MYRNDEEYLSAVDDILSNSKVKQMRDYIQHGKITTLDHCISVSYFAYRISKRLGLDSRACARGALLHDFYLYDWHDKKRKGHHIHGFTHASSALKNAEKYFKLSDVEKDVIKKHMFPLNIIPPKHKESFVVCMADKICALKETFNRR